jgi:hypothetical protein
MIAAGWLQPHHQAPSIRIENGATSSFNVARTPRATRSTPPALELPLRKPTQPAISRLSEHAASGSTVDRHEACMESRLAPGATPVSELKWEPWSG